MVTHFGQAAELFLHQAADGHRIDFLFIADIQFLGHIVHAGTAGNQPAAIALLADILHHFIMFIPDLANQLFQDILQRDDARSAAVFIHHNCHMVLAFPQSAQQSGDGGHAGCVQRGADQAFQLDIFIALAHGGKTVFFMYHANDVINGFVVDRQAGIAAVGKSFGHLVHGGIIRHGDHIHARGQNVLGFHIVKFNGAADQLAFAVGQLTVFFGFAHHSYQLTFGNGVLFVGIKAAGQKAFPFAKNKVQRPKYRHKGTKRRRKGHCNGFRHFLRHAFGGDFAKRQNQ